MSSKIGKYEFSGLFLGAMVWSGQGGAGIQDHG